MFNARIYKPSKNAMQSGRGGNRSWVLEYQSDSVNVPDSLMGWVSASDTLGQVRLSFSTLEDARKFAMDRGLSCTIATFHERKPKPRNYGDNFRYVPVDGKA